MFYVLFVILDMFSKCFEKRKTKRAEVVKAEKKKKHKMPLRKSDVKIVFLAMGIKFVRWFKLRELYFRIILIINSDNLVV